MREKAAQMVDMNELKKSITKTDALEYLDNNSFVVYDERLLHKLMNEKCILSFSKGFFAATIINAVIYSLILYLFQ